MAHVELIQIEHEYVDGAETVREAWHATSADNAYEWKLAEAEEYTTLTLTGQYPTYAIGFDGRLSVSSPEDIKGLRKLLDAIEERYVEFGKSVDAVEEGK